MNHTRDQCRGNFWGLVRCIIVGGAVTLVQAAAFAQSAKIYRVALVAVGAPDTGILGARMVRDFTQRGYTINGNIILERYAAQGELERLPGFIDALVTMHVDVIVTEGYPAAVAAKERAGNTPIVVTRCGDPVATGLAASLAHPGGNITGVSDIAGELSAKRLALLKEAVPNVRRVAVLWNENDLGMTLRYRSAETEAPYLGMLIVPLGVRAPNDFDAAFSEMTKNPPDAILMITDILTTLNRQRVIQYALQHRLPAIYEYAYLAHDGGLMAYGPDVDAIIDRAAELTDHILKGAKPADLPLELPTHFQFAVNLKTAKAIGLTMPESILLLADDVIE